MAATMFIGLPTAAVGCLLRLLLHFWSTECRPLPASDRERRLIARAHMPTWRHHGAQVLKIFADVTPGLESYKHLRDVRGTSLSVMAQVRNSKAKAKALRLVASSDTPIPAYAMGYVPKHEQAPPRKPREADPVPARKAMVDRGAPR